MREKVSERLKTPLSFDGRFVRDAEGRELLAVSALSQTVLYLGPEEPRVFLDALVEAVNGVREEG